MGPNSHYLSRVLAGAAACAVITAANPAFAQDARQQINIEAQPLSGAINALSRQTGVIIITPSELVEGRSAKAIAGNHTVESALAQILRGTGLEARSDPSGSFVVQSVPVRPAPASAPEPARRLAPEPSPQAPPAVLRADTVIVTAQKRAEDPQKVPISLTAFSAADLEALNIESVQDLAAYTPGFNAAQFSYGTPIFAIRGAENTFSTAGATKPTGIFIDEIYIPRASASNFSLFDVESVSVLKGPQGTLFGRNVTSGAVLVETREPSLTETEATIRVGAGNYDLREASGYVSAPLADNLAGSLSVDWKSRDGFGRDILTGKDVDDTDMAAGRGLLVFEPSEAFKLRASIDYSHDENGGRAMSSLTSSDTDRRTAELGIDQTYDRDIAGASVRMDFGDGPLTLTSLTGYRYSDSFEIFSRTGLAYQSLAAGFQEIGEEGEVDGAFSQEVRLSYENDALDVIAGLYYFQEKSERDFRKYRLAARTGRVIQDNFYDQTVETTSLAPFADMTWHVSDKFDLTGGVRYTYDHKDAAMELISQTAPAASFAAQDEDDWSEVTYRAVATYRPITDLTLFASYATGFTAGGYNTAADQESAFLTPFDPETSESLEVGLKSYFASGRGRFNISAFSTKYQDKQEFVFNSLTFIGNITNAAEASAQGIELDAGFSPTDVLTFNGTFAFLDTEYDSFDIPGGTPATGNDLGNSPEITYTLSADLDQPVSWGRLIANVSFTHKDPYNPSATLPNSIPATDIVDAQIGLASQDDQWRLMLWGRNLTDEAYPLIISNFIVDSEWLAPPRTYGLRLSYSY